MFNLVLWGGMAEPGSEFEDHPNIKIYTPGSCATHDFNKNDVKPKSVGLITVRKQEVSLETIPLKSTRPFIFRQLTTNFLQECLHKNPSAKNIDNILEKEVKYLINEFYESCKRSGSELREKPLLRIKIRTTDSCTLETAEIETKLKGLVVSHK